MKTICKIDLENFKHKPTPEELGAIVAEWDSEKQAMFFLTFGEALRNCCGGRHFMQWQAIADSICEIEEKLCDGSATELIEEIHCRIKPSQSEAA